MEVVLGGTMGNEQARHPNEMDEQPQYDLNKIQNQQGKTDFLWKMVLDETSVPDAWARCDSPCADH